MKKIAFLLLSLLCVAFTSLAQVQQGDLLISRSDYEKLKAEIKLANHQLSYYKFKADSLQAIYYELLDYHERYIHNNIERHQIQESSIKKLEQVNRDLKIQLQQQKVRTNEFKYAYQYSGRFREKAQVAVAWAGLMSITALMAMNEHNPRPAYFISGGSALVTVCLAINLNRDQDNLAH